MPPDHHRHATPLPRSFGILSWPGWLRVVAVLPIVALLWLAVGWTYWE